MVIFCMTHMDPPTRTGITNGDGSGCPKSIHKKLASIGMALWTWGSHPYRCCDRPTRLSGVDATVCLIVWKSPIHIGNWMNIGPRHPSGLTPRSLYRRIVSCDARPRSSLYFSCTCFINGCSRLMAFICRACFTVSGTMTSRTSIVKSRIARPKLLKKMLYNSTRLLIIGRIMIRFQASPTNSKARSLHS